MGIFTTPGNANVFPEANNFHLSRTAEVIIIKKLQNFIEPGLVTLSNYLTIPTEYARFQINYIEFLKTKAILKPAPMLDATYPMPDDFAERNFYVQGTPLYKHYYVVATSELTIGQSTGIDTSPPLLSNASVLRVTASVATDGRGKATIVLKNPNNQYTFTENPLMAGRTIFESNDIVLINMPDLNGNILRRVFTGLITTITQDIQTSDTILSTITIECEDNLKLLAQSRTCYLPSLTPAEAGGVDYNGFNPDFTLQPPHQILTSILSRAYCDLNTAQGSSSNFLGSYLEEIYEIFSSLRNNPSIIDIQNAATQRDSVISSFLTLPTPETGVSPVAGFIMVSGQEVETVNVTSTTSVTQAPTPAPLSLSDTITPPPFAVGSNSAPQFSVGSNTPSTSSTPTPFASASALSPTASAGTPVITETINAPSIIYGFRSVRNNVSVPTTSIDAAAEKYAFGGKNNVGELAFIITGTAQPAYAKFTQGSPDVYFSDWKSGLTVCNEIRDKLGFEFFANEVGTIIFRPLNTLLPYDFSLFNPRYQPTDALDPVESNGQVGSEYWLQQPLIQHQTYSDTDNNVFTVSRTIGTLAESSNGTGEDVLNRGGAVDVTRFLKLGARYAPINTVLGLTDNDACSAYSWGTLTRINSESDTASITYTGDSRLKAGNPCYIPSRNAIYYITEVTHEFVAGDAYRTYLTLKYGRKPLAILPSGIQALALQTGGLQTTSQNTNIPGVKVSNASQAVDQSYITQLNSYPNFLQYYNSLVTLTDGVLGSVAGTDSIAPPQNTSDANNGLTYLDYIKNNLFYLSFQGYVWEVIAPLTFEEILTHSIPMSNYVKLIEVVNNAKSNSSVYNQQIQKTAAAASLALGVTTGSQNIAVQSYFQRIKAWTYGVVQNAVSDNGASITP